MKAILPSAIIFLSLLSKSLLAQGDAHQNFIDSTFELKQYQNNAVRDSLIVWQEKIVLQIDKEFVASKDHLFFKAYVLTGPNQLRASASDVLNVELLDESGNLVKKQYHEIKDGTSEGSFEVPKRLEAGQYYFRAYTRWMLNYGPEKFALKMIEIGNPDKLDGLREKASDLIEFFPEGGDLVAGLTNRMIISGFKDLSDNAKIIDDRGETIASVKKYATDVATTIFKPNKNTDYFIDFGSGEKVPLPSVKDKGITLMLNNNDPEKFHVKIESSPELVDEKLFLKGQSNGVVYFETQVDFKSGTTAEMEIATGEIPQGILYLSLEDEFDQVWAERPVLIKKEEIIINIEPFDHQTLPENVNKYLLRVTDYHGKPVKTELSLGVKQATQSGQIGQWQHRISNRSQRFIEDLRVVADLPVRGIQFSKQSGLPSEILYQFQKGLEFYGQAYDFDNVLLSNTKIQILISTEDDAIAKEVTTNGNGMFKLTNMQIDGEASMVFRTVAEKTKEKMVKVIPYEYEVPPLGNEKTNDYKNRLATAQKSDNYFSKNNFEKQDDDGFNRLIALEGVTLTDKKIEKRPMPPVYGIEGHPNRTVVQDPERPKSFFELLLNIPGISVSGNFNYPTVSTLRGRSGGTGGAAPNTFGSTLDQAGPLWVIDGFIYENSSTILAEWGITALDIDRIEFVPPFDANASMWGTRADKGVVLVYTRNGSDIDYIPRKDAQLTYEGFHESVDFKTYQNGLSSREKSSNPLLYWNPSLQTNKKGEVTIEFKVPNNTQNIELQAIAITPNGETGEISKTF